MKQPETIRLQKYLSERGVASRRKAEELIAMGKVKVNGRQAVIGDKVDPRRDLVMVAGKRVEQKGERMYVMLHKPRGFVTTMRDELGRRDVTQLVKDAGARIYPVGRLDKDSEGLLLMTNDGEFANLMMHPRGEVPKTYRVTVRSKITDSQLTALSTGVEIDGRHTLPALVRILQEEEGRAVLEMIIHEGRNRQIRKMCEAVGLEVVRLKRTAVGSLRLGMLPQDRWRRLTQQEIRDLIKTAKGKKETEKA